MPLTALAVSKAQVRDKAYKLNDADSTRLRSRFACAEARTLP